MLDQTPGQSLSGQTALVTGANSGLGEATARDLAARGAKVIVNYVAGPDQAEAIVADIKKAGGEATAIQGDVSDPASVESMFGQVLARYKTLDILVNNAGLQKDSNLFDMPVDFWNKTLSVDLTGQFLCAQQAARIFRTQGVRADIKSRCAGKIICMSSVHQIIPWAGHVNYAAAKGGVDMLMKSLAQELASYKIRVVGIAPGAIKTAINKTVWGDEVKAKELLNLIPYGRIGDPEDVARTIGWLCSDDADYITGTTIFIDGGMTLYPGFQNNG